MPSKVGRDLSLDPRYGGIYNSSVVNSTVTFCDTAGLHIVNESSLLELKLTNGDAFRPNITVSGPQPFEEDNWVELSISNSMKYRTVMPALRCRVVNNTQSSEQESGSELLKGLQKVRKCNFRSACPFGIKLNSLLSESGKEVLVTVGSEIEVIRKSLDAITVPVTVSDLREWSDCSTYNFFDGKNLLVVLFGVVLAAILFCIQMYRLS